MTRHGNSTLVLLLTFLSAVAHAGTIPYEVVMVNYCQSFLAADCKFARADIDSAELTAQPIPFTKGPTLGGWSVLAVESSKSIVLTGNTDFGGGLAQLDPKAERWEFTDFGFEAGVLVPFDMEIGIDGDLIIGGEFGVVRINRSTGRIKNAISLPDGIPWTNESSPAVEIDSSGAIIFDVVIHESLQSIDGYFRQRLDEPFAERLAVNLDGLADFTLVSDDSIMAVGDGRIYQVSLDTGVSKIVFEDEVLSKAGKIKLDPDGRVVVRTFAPDEQLVKLVRIDLDTGTTDVFPLDPSVAGFPFDIDILIIPEPSSVALLVLGSLSLALCFRNRIPSGDSEVGTNRRRHGNHGCTYFGSGPGGERTWTS